LVGWHATDNYANQSANQMLPKNTHFLNHWRNSGQLMPTNLQINASPRAAVSCFASAL
jgi:hypothetical protein